MKTLRASALLFAGALCAATVTPVAAQQAPGPSSNVAWTAETLSLVRNGDPQRGEMLGIKLECATCHGDKGVSINDAWPSLAGQTAGYTYKVLRDYRDQKLAGTQRGELMTYIVEGMSDQDMADIASYYAQFDLPPARAATVQDAAERLHLLGDPERFIPPCSVCHGNEAQGDFPDFPVLGRTIAQASETQPDGFQIRGARQ